MSTDEVLLVYDKQCPACNQYCQWVRIRAAVGELKLIDARENSQIMAQITQQGMDIDQGMVLVMGGRFYYGADAIHALALLGSRSGMFNKLNYWIFRSRYLSAVFYPVLRLFRNWLLKLLGKSKINNLGIEGNERF